MSTYEVKGDPQVHNEWGGTKAQNIPKVKKQNIVNTGSNTNRTKSIVIKIKKEPECCLKGEGPQKKKKNEEEGRLPGIIGEPKKTQR